MNKIVGQIKKKSQTFMNFVDFLLFKLELTQVEKDHQNPDNTVLRLSLINLLS